MSVAWHMRQTVCGIPELDEHGSANVTHVLSILDPDADEPDALGRYPTHERLVLRFHDLIAPAAGMIPPRQAHIERLLAFGRDLGNTDAGHLLVHCHAGVSRSTAAIAALLLQANPTAEEDAVFEHIAGIRPQAWPNSRMVALADDLLGRQGRFSAALRRFHGRQLREDPRLADTIRGFGRDVEVDAARQSR